MPCAGTWIGTCKWDKSKFSNGYSLCFVETNDLDMGMSSWMAYFKLLSVDSAEKSR